MKPALPKPPGRIPDVSGAKHRGGGVATIWAQGQPAVGYRRFPVSNGGWIEPVATRVALPPRPRTQARAPESVEGGAAGTGDGEAGGTWRADPRFAGDGYLLLDSHRVEPEDLRRDNAAALLETVTDQEMLDGVLGALVECDTPPELLARVEEVRRRANGRDGSG